MDTGTHLVIGLGLAGLAHVDPVVASDSAVATAIMIGTIIGSQAPDFDTVLRLRGNATYIKNHRGLSHSLPAIAIWTLLITGGLALFFDGLPIATALLWVFIAVAFHVFTDLFNTYGTQAARPFSNKWISWNIIHIFDPVIFISHVLAIFLWAVHLVEPERLFPLLYAFLALYYVWRTWVHYRLESTAHRSDPQYAKGDKYTFIPTVNLHHCQVVKSQANGSYMLGEYKNDKLQWIDCVRCDVHPAVEASKKHPNIASLLYFTSFACADVKEHEWGYEVRWMDVRYRHRKQYPFVAVLLMDRQYQTIDSYVGWLSESRLGKRLRVDLY
ncbi:metal-dependent hydrolase [Paenibacillus ginsengihumi]|uniref:metal-dependent hydrolase n=1 Tax=Paenibacillus ginsengihumi TaxID=431596 RepID=UPI000362E60F|nr:metal-dependent hydrolase [Paenibacillus ginsengihumi]